MQKFFSEVMGEFRETLTTGLLKVERSQKGEAPVRVRLIACMNPRRRLSEYLYPVQAILDSNPFQDPVDVTCWDAFVPFAMEDVPYDNIAEAVMNEPPMPEELYRAHVMWVWSRRAEDIIYGPGVVETIKALAKRLHARYHIASAPLVHTEVHDTLMRVAVAFAALRHSTDEHHQKIVVSPEHVEEAYQLLTATYDMLKLGEFRDYENGNVNLLDSELIRAAAAMSFDDFSIPEALKTGGRTSKELADILQKTEESVRRYNYPVLLEHSLVVTGSSGCRLSDKGRKFIKVLLEHRDAVNEGAPGDGSGPHPMAEKVTASQPSASFTNESGTIQSTLMDAPLPKGRTMEQAIAEIKRNMVAAFDVNWKEARLDDVGRHLKHIFDGDQQRTLAFFRKACEQHWLPYTIFSNGVVRRE